MRETQAGQPPPGERSAGFGFATEAKKSCMMLLANTARRARVPRVERCVCDGGDDDEKAREPVSRQQVGADRGKDGLRAEVHSYRGLPPLEKACPPARLERHGMNGGPSAGRRRERIRSPITPLRDVLRSRISLTRPVHDTRQGQREEGDRKEGVMSRQARIPGRRHLHGLWENVAKSDAACPRSAQRTEDADNP